MDLLATPSVDFSRHPMTAALATERGPERYRRPGIRIDNARLGRLTRALHARGGCGGERDCERCRLCDNLLAEVLTGDDPDERAAHATALEGLVGELADGSLTAAGPVDASSESPSCAPAKSIARGRGWGC
jgi:hypothetical protein